MSKICQIPFQETEQQAKKLAEVIAKHKKVPGAVMPVLQQAQDIYGYLPYEVMQRIAEGLDTSMEEIYGVATFLRSVFALSERTVQRQRLFGHGVLRQIERRGHGQAQEPARRQGRRNHSRRQIFHSGYPLHRLLRFGSPFSRSTRRVYGKVTVADVEGIINTYRNK